MHSSGLIWSPYSQPKWETGNQSLSTNFIYFAKNLFFENRMMRKLHFQLFSSIVDNFAPRFRDGIIKFLPHILTAVVLRHRVARFFLVQHTKARKKLTQNVPNGPKTYQLAVQCIYQMAINYTNNCHNKTL
jgi:hypothetical protein